MNKEQIIKFYNESCENSEVGWQASRWFSEESQYERFVVAGSFLFPNCSVLDVGCGQGDFYEFIKCRYKNIKYKGIDFSKSMILKAKEKYKKDFENKDLLEVNEKFDCVFALGAFNLQVENQREYIKNHLEKCFECCNNRAVIFLKGNQPIEEYEQMCYYSPVEILELSLSITPNTLISTSFLPNEITVCLYKTQ
jgi:SAM-dependent methyltransferase